MRTGRALVRRAFNTANEIGDLTFAAYSCNNLITNLLASGEPLPDGDIGEVCLGSPAVMDGYWRDEGASAEAFIEDGSVRTGDLGGKASTAEFTRTLVKRIQNG